MTQGELLQYLVDTLDGLGIPSMIVGSHASVYYGEPRFTQDVDIVVELTAAALPGLWERFPPSDFYVSDDFREGRSDQHLRDIGGMLAVSGADLDLDYIARWARHLGLVDLWDAARRRALDGR